MKVIIDINHPCQVHFFKNLIARLRSDKHKVLVTARDKDVTIALLRELGIHHITLSKQATSLAGMGFELVNRDYKLFRCALKFKPDVMLAKTGVSIGIVGKLLGVPAIVEEDTEHARLQRFLGLPFVDTIITGTGYLAEHGKKQRVFKGVWVQSYLDPRYFTPDPVPLKEAGIDPESRYIVLRTVSWTAAHDLGLKGASIEKLSELVHSLSRFGRVIISTESDLPGELEKYKNPLAARYMHNLLAFAQLYIGEGATMAAEASILGTPSIYCNPLKLGYLNALEEKYELVYNYSDLAEGANKAELLLAQDSAKKDWIIKKNRLLDESDDITDFFMKIIREKIH